MEQDRSSGLQIARALAALSIAYFHSWHVIMPFPANTAYPIPLLKDFGWISVDFFFAISGFVLGLVITRPSFKPMEFLIWRAFQLFPLWIATARATAYLYRHYLGWPPNATPGFFLYSFTLLPTEGYPFYDLGWSLQHELAFYVLAALIAPHFGLAGLILFLSVGVISDHFLALPWYVHQYAFYYGNFLAGIAAFLTYRRLRAFGFLVPLGTGLLLMYCFTWWVGRSAYPIGLFFVLVAFVNIEFNEKSVWERAGVLLGDASYSIYLIHPLVFLFIYAKLQSPLPPIWSEEFIRFGAIAFICLVACLSWRYFETPINNAAKRIAARVTGRVLLAYPGQPKSS